MWSNLTGRCLRRALYSVGTLCLATLPPASSGAADPLNMVVIGGLAGVSQFAKLERPFWTDELPRLSHGRVRATVRAYDESGFRGQEMLQLMRLGVVPFGTALLAVAAGDEPELNAVDLPVMNPDMHALRASVGRFRERLRTILLERYRVELLGVYAYPAQVLFCTKAFASLSDMAGRRVRTSSVGQSELITALGGTPVVLPFAEMTRGVRDGLVDCAITGTLSGHETGLADVTTHVHALAINWGLSFFGANAAAWEAIPPDMREVIRAGVVGLERKVWDLAEADTALGLACDTGSPTCPAGSRKAMSLVSAGPDDEAHRRTLLATKVLPRWVERCGMDCVNSWNALLSDVVRVDARPE